MSVCRVALAAAALIVCATASIVVARAAPGMTERRDGALEMDGRRLRCGNARSRLDAGLPNLGMSMPDAGLLVFNPALLRRQPRTVRMFVFHHECGHQYVGASELGADCWAVKRGVRDGWLGKSALGQICRSFGNGPATFTHPAGSTRCANLNRCFGVASAELERERRVAAAKRAPVPRLVSGPQLVRDGVVR